MYMHMHMYMHSEERALLARAGGVLVLRGARDRWCGLCELQAVVACAKSAGGRWRRCAGWRGRRVTSSGARLGRGGAGRARRRAARLDAAARGHGAGLGWRWLRLAYSGATNLHNREEVTWLDPLLIGRPSFGYFDLGVVSKVSCTSLGSSLLEHYSYLITYSARI